MYAIIAAKQKVIQFLFSGSSGMFFYVFYCKRKIFIRCSTKSVNPIIA